MADTDRLIEQLSAAATPVKRLAPPLLRALGWVLLATAVVAALCWMRGLRPDLAARLREHEFMVSVAAAWLTGVTATGAAFALSVPDRSRAWMFAPLPSLALWLYGFAYGCLANWIAIPQGAPLMADSMSCLRTLTYASVPLGIVLWLMLRRAKPLRSASTALVGALAVAGFADTAHLLINMVNPTAMVLLMNVGTSAVIVLVGALGGRRALVPV